MHTLPSVYKLAIYILKNPIERSFFHLKRHVTINGDKCFETEITTYLPIASIKREIIIRLIAFATAIIKITQIDTHQQ